VQDVDVAGIAIGIYTPLDDANHRLFATAVVIGIAG
jgi:hypothetical protein